MRKWLARLPKNCAVFAANDEVALEVVQACRSVGRRIPGDLTLLGVDDIDAYCLAGEPRISSVRIDFELAGFKACELRTGLWRRLRAPDGCPPRLDKRARTP